jgi:hypothetical protein
MNSLNHSCSPRVIESGSRSEWRKSETTLGPPLMKMDFGEVLEIRDHRNHSPATPITLALLLAGIVNTTPGPKRDGLYEVEGAQTVYYIYRSPFSGEISLLATWKKMPQATPQFDTVVAVGWRKRTVCTPSIRYSEALNRRRPEVAKPAV